MRKRFRQLGRCVALLALALVPGLMGQGGQIPLESHEVFVARTAEEMIARRDFVVPHFNDEPRINKPPLSYWLVAAVDWCTGADGRVTPFESRAPSILGGVLCVVCVFLTGRLLFGELEGWVGAMMLSGSVGFMMYTHSARPDMLYAGWIALAGVGFAALFLRGATVVSGRQTSWIALGSIVVGLGMATLTKSPWAPMALLLGAIVAAWTIYGRHAVGRMVRPGCSAAAILLPFIAWYGLMLVAVQNEAGASWGAEVGRRLDSGSILKWLEPYYAIRMFHLAAPWWPVYPIALVLPVFRFWRKRPEAMFAWWVFMISMLAWQVLPGRRPHYTLPVLVLLCPLMATIVCQALLRGVVWSKRPRVLTGFRVQIATLVVACIAGAVATAGASASLLFGVLACVFMGVGVLIESGQLARPGAVASVGVLAALLTGTVASSGLGWSDERSEARAFALAVGEQVSRDAPLIAWRGDWEVAQYYLSRTIPRSRDVDEIREMLRDRGCVYLLTDRRLDAPPEFRVAEVDVQTVLRTEIRKSRLYRVSLSDDGTMIALRTPVLDGSGPIMPGRHRDP